MSVLFKNAKILATVDGSFKVLDGAYLGVSGKKINYIGTSRPSFEYDSEKDMYGKLLMPGLVNGHAHSAMNLLKGIGSDLPLQEWLNTIWPVEGRLPAEPPVSLTCTSSRWSHRRSLERAE